MWAFLMFIWQRLAPSLFLSCNLTTSHAPLFLAGGDHSIQRCLGVLLNSISNTNSNINSGIQ